MEYFSMESLALTESTYYILLSLYHPQHGYGIMQQTEQLSGGRVHLAAGTLYGALTSLCKKGWMDPSPARRKRQSKKGISAYRRGRTGIKARACPLAAACGKW